VSAVVALLAPLALLAVVVAVLLRQPLALLAAAVCLGVGVSAAAFAITRTGLLRAGAAALAVAALAAAVVLQLAAVGSLLVVALLVLLVVLLVVAGAAATRYALGRDMASLKQARTPGSPVGPAARPVLLMNPRSGGGQGRAVRTGRGGPPARHRAGGARPRRRPAPAGRGGGGRRRRRDRDGRR